MIIYLVDDIINIVYKKRVIKGKFKSINKGFIINKEEFINEFLKLGKKEKIKSMFSLKIEIVLNTYFRESDKYYIESIFNDLGFIKIVFRDIREFFIKDAIYIELNNTYMVINLDKGIYLDLDYFKDIPRILDGFNIDKDILFFGVNKEIVNINLINKDIYYLQNKENYITDSLLLSMK